MRIEVGEDLQHAEPVVGLFTESEDPATADRHAGVLDVIPTLLHIRGLAVADDMDGEVLVNLLVENAARRPVNRIASYEAGPPPTDRPRPIATEADEDVLERLRSLGYLGGE